MLRILDDRTGRPVPAAPARRGLTRIEAYASGLDLTSLRVLLTADVLVRALELSGTPVWTILTAPRRRAELRTAATALAVRPFEDDRDLASVLGEAQAIHVTAEPASALGEGPVMHVAPVRWEPDREHSRPGDARDAHAGGGADAGRGAGVGGDVRPGVDGVPGSAAGRDSDRASRCGPGTAAGAGADSVPERTAERTAGSGAEPGGEPSFRSALAALLADPEALRLALLSVPREEPLRLDAAVLDEAAARLRRWRRGVAGWARRPSRPVPEPVRARLRAAWEDDLDLPGVLAVLADVARDPELPDGARFETFVHADRLLALDLARGLGSPA